MMYEPRDVELSKNNRNSPGSTNNEMEEVNTVYKHPDITHIVEFIRNKLYFATLNSGRKEARSVPAVHLFTIDDELVYQNFYNDFGPLNIACLYRYCYKINKKLRNPVYRNKQIVHCTSQQDEMRANSAYLIGSYAVLYLNKSPKEAYKSLIIGNDLPFKPFQDASIESPIYNINLLDCLNAIHKAASIGFFDFEDFDLAEYEKYKDMRNGDLNWMIPQKFLAFVGPSTEPGTVYHPPEFYTDYFVKNGVVAVVRLNKKTYDASRFTKAGIMHYDMFMPDGTVPPRRILNQFLQLAENTNGAIAVHCKAGLGRTGSLIAAYLIKHYKMTAREAIAWLRICRPGSIIGHQQTWLENMENNLLNAGLRYKSKNFGDSDIILHHKWGIYSIAQYVERNINATSNSLEITKQDSQSTSKPKETKLTRILGKLRSISGADDSEGEGRDTVKCGRKRNSKHVITQGDKLNKIKFDRL